VHGVSQKGVGACADAGDLLAVRAAIAPDVPAGTHRVDLSGRQALVGAVIELRQQRVHRGVGVGEGQRSGVERARHRAAAHGCAASAQHDVE
jgi:hypothetical protein